ALELKTLRRPRKPAELDEAPRLALGVLDEVLVAHLRIALAGVAPRPIAHERVEREIEATRVEQVVRVVVVRERGREELSIVAQARVERVAAQADDLRFR